ncbi:MAG: lytic murein transglycosylase, partial [bacterium]
MTKKVLTLVLIFSIISLVTPVIVVTAESSCSDQVSGKSRAQLEADLEACNKEIEQWTDTLNKTRADSASFSRDVAALTAKINAAQASIKGKNIAIANLSKDIATKQAKISELDSRLAKGKQTVADILRKTNEIDSYSLAEAILGGKDFSEFFIDVDSYASTEKALEILFQELRGTRALTEAEKTELNKKKQAEANAKAVIEAAKKEVEVSQTEKKNLLAISQSKEKTYSQVLADRQARAAQIKAILFPLRDAGAIPFGTALQYAETANAKTGVRPALILGILQQESNLGANVGSCVITDINSGGTRSVNSGKVFSNGIHPTRDLPLLQSLLPALGRDPLNTKVSCPISSTFGYGGAMGPAQFIPSTWKIMQNKVGDALGKDTPDPWAPADAIMAMALFLKDLGASAGTYTAERNAACRYYGGGSSCTTTTASYGNSVMAKATDIQNNMINPLQ